MAYESCVRVGAIVNVSEIRLYPYKKTPNLGLYPYRADHLKKPWLAPVGENRGALVRACASVYTVRAFGFRLCRSGASRERTYGQTSTREERNSRREYLKWLI
jgi:hypothetical protein